MTGNVRDEWWTGPRSRRSAGVLAGIRLALAIFHYWWETLRTGLEEQGFGTYAGDRARRLFLGGRPAGIRIQGCAEVNCAKERTNRNPSACYQKRLKGERTMEKPA